MGNPEGLSVPGNCYRVGSRTEEGKDFPIQAQSSEDSRDARDPYTLAVKAQGSRCAFQLDGRKYGAVRRHPGHIRVSRVTYPHGLTVEEECERGRRAGGVGSQDLQGRRQHCDGTIASIVGTGQDPQVISHRGERDRSQVQLYLANLAPVQGQLHHGLIHQVGHPDPLPIEGKGLRPPAYGKFIHHLTRQRHLADRTRRWLLGRRLQPGVGDPQVLAIKGQGAWPLADGKSVGHGSVGGQLHQGVVKGVGHPHAVAIEQHGHRVLPHNYTGAFQKQ